jgi:hypothetical protein
MQQARLLAAQECRLETTSSSRSFSLYTTYSIEQCFFFYKRRFVSKIRLQKKFHREGKNEEEILCELKYVSECSC